jgi:hypothetical protein
MCGTLLRRSTTKQRHPTPCSLGASFFLPNRIMQQIMSVEELASFQKNQLINACAALSCAALSKNVPTENYVLRSSFSFKDNLDLRVSLKKLPFFQIQIGQVRCVGLFCAVLQQFSLGYYHVLESFLLFKDHVNLRMSFENLFSPKPGSPNHMCGTLLRFSALFCDNPNQIPVMFSGAFFF